MWSLALPAVIAAVHVPVAASNPAADDRWAGDMARFAAQDRQNPPQAGGVVFVGSSSIRLWDLQQYFPQMTPPPVNRGFGGSQLPDCLRHLDRLVLSRQPGTVVLYCGDNDIAAGRSPRQVHEDFCEVARRLHDRTPRARLIYIAIKPSIARWSLAAPMREANRLIQAECGKHPLLRYVDVWAPMLNQQGGPRQELFVQDGLHLSDAGYRLWRRLVQAAIEAQP